MTDWLRRASRIKETLATEPLDILRRERANELLGQFNSFALCEWLDIVGDLGGGAWLCEASDKEIVTAMQRLDAKQLAIVELLYNYIIEGQDIDARLLQELTRPVGEEEQKLDDARFYAEAGHWDKAAEVLGVGKREVMSLFPDLAARERELRREVSRLNEVAQERCKEQRVNVPGQQEESQSIPDKYAWDGRRQGQP